MSGRAREVTSAASRGRRPLAAALGVLLCLTLLGAGAVAAAGGWYRAELGVDDADRRPLVVTSVTILGDLAVRVGGERVRVHSLLGPGQDPHTYEPAPRDALALTRARVVLLNGYHLDFWAERLLAGRSGHRAAGQIVVRLAEEVPAEPLPWPGQTGRADPHLWMDPTLVIHYVEHIRDALSRADPAGAAEYGRRAEALAGELEELDRWIAERVATVPAERRKLVTTHDAYRYFGRRYGIEVLDTVWGISTEEEPSAAQLAELFENLRRHGVPAFVETTINPKLMREIAAQAGVRIGGQLYADALGAPGSGAETYVGMMRHNVETIVAALRAP